MAALKLTKTVGGIIPLCDEDLQVIKKMKIGTVIECDFKQKRNSKFHRKFFALLQLGYEYWEPEPQNWKGFEAVKNFDVFREQVTILSGFRDVTFNLDGSVKVKAKSISFASMDDIEFEKVYRKVLDVIWSKVTNTVFEDKAHFDRAVNQLLSY